MSGLVKTAGNVVSLYRWRDEPTRRASVLAAAISVVSGEGEQDEPADALVAVAIFPDGDTRQVVSMVEPEQVPVLIDSLLSLVDQLNTFKNS